MNRKTFLATIAGVFAAPFVVKAKPEFAPIMPSITAEEIARIYKIPPTYIGELKRATFKYVRMADIQGAQKRYDHSRKMFLTGILK